MQHSMENIETTYFQQIIDGHASKFKNLQRNLKIWLLTYEYHCRMLAGYKNHMY